MAGRAGTVLFRVAGGAGVGFGHVMRALSLARALHVVPRLSIRGGPLARAVAEAHGATADPCVRVRDLKSAGLRLLVLDDPSRRAATPWVEAARRLGTPIVSLHDLGLAAVASDLAIDGSLVQRRRRWPSAQLLAGAAFAVLDPEIARLRARRVYRRPEGRVIVALGGGTLGRTALVVGAELQRAIPGATIVVAPGFVTAANGGTGRLRCVAPGAFRRELARASVAVVGGGVTLAEACALGVATLGVAAVPAQVPTVRAFARRGLALDGGRLADRSPKAGARLARRVAIDVTRLLASESARNGLAGKAMAAFDGRGAQRVAQAVRRLVNSKPGNAQDDR